MEITIEQRTAAASGQAVHLADPETQERFVLLREDVYERVHGGFDDWNPRAMYPVMSKVMQEDWNDPSMDVYDQP